MSDHERERDEPRTPTRPPLLDPEAERILATLTTLRRATFDAKLAVLELLSDPDYSRYVPGEAWHSRYFGYKAKQLLRDVMGEMEQIESTPTMWEADGRWWNLAAFAPNQEKPLLPLEMRLADLLDEGGAAGVGFIIASGTATDDEGGDLLRWAVQSAHGEAKVAVLATPAAAPFFAAYRIEDLTLVYLRDQADLERAVADGFLAKAGGDGALLDASRIPQWAPGVGPTSWGRSAR